MKRIKDKLLSLERDFVFFLLVGVFTGIAQSVDGSTLSNYLKEVYNIGVMQRTILEMPRELPGFLVVFVIGFLYAYGDIRIAAIANLSAAAGMFLLGIIPNNYYIMVVSIFVYSMGQHVYMPLTNSIGMSFANDGRLGRKLGQFSSVNTAALLFGSLLLFVLFKFIKVNYTVSFTIGAVSFLVAAFLLFSMNHKRTEKIRQRFLFRKQYSLFYIMSLIYGARKQLFITFAPWVLVNVFSQDVATMTVLFFLISISSIFIRPFVGYLIDKMGERFVLSAEALIMIVVCLLYAFAQDILPSRAVFIVYGCYILDQSLSAVVMARATYLKKIEVEQGDVSPTLSAGISIDHIMSMILPFFGGILWSSSGEFGYKYVFLCGAAVCLINLFVALKVKTNINNSRSIIA